jgi:hypothetical protein
MELFVGRPGLGEVGAIKPLQIPSIEPAKSNGGAEEIRKTYLRIANAARHRTLQRNGHSVAEDARLLTSGTGCAYRAPEIDDLVWR